MTAHWENIFGRGIHLFDHPAFRKYGFESIPLDQDLFLMNEKWMSEYEESRLRMLAGAEYEPVGYISYAAARSVSESSLELSWYPTITTRFHQVSISLPREQFVACVELRDSDENPRVFIKDEWLDHLFLRSHSVFALIDAAGVKDALKNNVLTREKLLQLREQIDAVAERYLDVSFISFADSLLLKSNWHAGLYNTEVKYNYEPEKFIRIISEIQSVYLEVLGLNVFAILTQGSNAYYEDSLLHISAAGNHISLNSLGLPFAQLISIDKAARAAIRGGIHGRAELYMDESFFHSLNFDIDFEKESCGKYAYREPFSDESTSYFSAGRRQIIENLRKPE